MCNMSGVIFCAKSLHPRDVEGKDIIEVGAANVNGGLRDIFENWKPQTYLGVDIEKARGVDQVCDVLQLDKTFGSNRYDVVISTEMLEHVRDWRSAINNLKSVCKPGGTLIITTRSIGMHYHAFPNDFWRFELDDMRKIFRDWKIQSLESDPELPGVFLKATKLTSAAPCDLSDVSLFNILIGERSLHISDKDADSAHHRKQIRRIKARELAESVAKSLRGIVKRVV